MKIELFKEHEKVGNGQKGHGAKTLWNEGVYESKYSQSVLKYQKQFIEQMEGD